ncbi:PLP-dependent transferase [Candidatus Gracilibacteria bacterium]|nr:PLP-dependent transferase [Candidatus Gracilibacteria bacterium]
MPESIFTTAVHAGRPQSGDSIASVPAIELSVSFRAASAADLHARLGGDQSGFSYSRYGSPTLEAFEMAVAALEGAETARACASGMAAIHVALLLTEVGAEDTLLVAQDCYGATFSLLDTVFRQMNVQTVFVDATDTGAVAARWRSIARALCLSSRSQTRCGSFAILGQWPS